MLATTLAVAALLTQDMSWDVAAFLRNHIDFSESQLRQLTRGEIVAKMLTSESNREIALFAAARIAVPRTQAFTQLRNVETLIGSEYLTQFGEFSRPPVASDLKDLEIAPGDLDALRECRLADCDVNVSATVINELRALDWSSPGIRAPVTDFVRRHLLDYVRNYLTNGVGALIVYQHKPEPLALADGFQFLLEESPYVFEYVPELHRHLQEFPDWQSPNARDMLFWAVEEFGLRPLSTVTHVTIYDPPAGSVQASAIALKRIYASHYFHAGFTVVGLVDYLTSGDGEGTVLLYLDRSLFDTKVGGIKRRVAESQLRDNLRSRLQAMRRALEGARGEQEAR